jgi:hypothetical protein
LPAPRSGDTIVSGDHVVPWSDDRITPTLSPAAIAGPLLYLK